MDTEAHVTALAGGIARIRGAAGQVAGCGFVFGTNLVCTCAHVITAAVGGDPRDARPPAGQVVVEFPLLAGCPSVPADLDPAGWRPIRHDEGGDIAVLRLREAVPGSHALPLVAAAEVWQHSVRAFGFPERHTDGLWVAAALRAGQGSGWIQMEVAADGPRIGPGFSGSPVWDEDLRGVVGMTVAAESGATTAFLLPANEIAEVHGTPGCPYRGLEPFLERHAMLFYGRAGEAEHLFQSDPITALQLTLAAWHNAENEPVTRNLLAYEALLREYVALRSTDRIIAGYWPSYLSDFRMSDDGSTMVMNTGANTIVLTGLASTRPRTWQVSDDAGLDFALSPDGRLLATASDRGDITLWNVAGHRPIKRLATAFPGQYRDLTFSADNTRLLSVTNLGAAVEHDLEIWSLPDGTPLVHRIQSFSSDAGMETVQFAGPDILVTMADPVEGDSAHEQITLQGLDSAPRGQLSTGSSAVVVRHGTALAYYDDNGFVHVRDIRTGQDRITPAKDPGGGASFDATGNYVITWNGTFNDAAETYRTLTVTDLRTLAVYQLVAPNWQTDDMWDDMTLKMVGVVPRPGGGIYVYLAQGTSLLRLHADRPETAHYDRYAPPDASAPSDQIGCPTDVPMNSVGSYIYKPHRVGVTSDGLQVDALRATGACQAAYPDSGLEFLGGTNGIPIANLELPGTISTATMRSVGSVSRLDIVFDAASTNSSTNERKALSLALDPESWFRQLCGSGTAS